MSERPLLSICTPTYERPTELRAQLSNISSQLRSLPKQKRRLVQFIVSDNASQYNVEALIKEFSEQFPIEFYRQQQNFGPTRNFEFCYREALGEFVMILSDDDRIVAGGIERILNELILNSPDILFLPFSVLSNHAETPTIAKRIKRDDFLKHVNYLPTLVSSCVLKKKLLDIDTPKHLDTNLHHYYYFLLALEHGEHFFAFGDKILELPYGDNSGGYNWFEVFGEQFFKIVDEFPACNIERASLNNVEKLIMLERIVPVFANRKIKGHTLNRHFSETSATKIFALLTKRGGRFLLHWITVFPIYLLPALMIAWAKSAFKWYRDRRHSV